MLTLQAVVCSIFPIAAVQYIKLKCSPLLAKGYFSACQNWRISFREGNNLSSIHVTDKQIFHPK